MGQYYTALVIDDANRVMKLEPSEFDNLAKLTEHSWISNEFVNAVYSLIHNRRRRVAWIGDYSDDDYDPLTEAYAKALPFKEFKVLYDIAHGETPSISKGLFYKTDWDILDYDTHVLSRC